MAKQERAGWRVWFHRYRSIAWMIIAVVAWPFGWVYSVAFVSMASLYANIASDWSNSEAADDREIKALIAATNKRLDQLDWRLDRIEAGVNQLEAAVKEQSADRRRSSRT